MGAAGWEVISRKLEVSGKKLITTNLLLVILLPAKKHVNIKTCFLFKKYKCRKVALTHLLLDWFVYMTYRPNKTQYGECLQ